MKTAPGLIVFDFDGTLSWLRHGWPGIMLEVFREHLPPRAGESAAETAALLNGIALGLNGQPTIRQMIRFAEVVRDRGGPQLDPETMRALYQERLDREIAARTASIQTGQKSEDDYVVAGTRTFLTQLSRTGIPLAVLSSTIEHRVKEEAALLGLTDYFGGRIHGGTGDPAKFTKRAVFERLLAETGVEGSRLLSFGDGPVEMADTKALGGIAIGVCSDEDVNGSGRLDPFKQNQLRAAGADVVIADFRSAYRIVKQFFPDAFPTDHTDNTDDS